MKQIFSTARNMVFAILLGALSVSMSHAWLDGNDDCCMSNFGIMAKGGVAPILWTDRDCFSACSSACSSVNFQTVGKFSNYFKIPWTVGAELDYMLSECSLIYVDFQYRQANGKSNIANNIITVPCATPGIPVSVVFNKYKSYSGYLGADYIFGNWGCGCADLGFFAGIKVGFTRFASLSATFAQADLSLSELVSFGRRTVFSGGGSVGVDYTICDNFDVVLMVEFIAQAGPNLNRTAIALAPVISNLSFGSIGTEVIFPIELGFRYSF